MKNFFKILIFGILILTGLKLNNHYGWDEFLLASDNFLKISAFVRENYLLAVFLYLAFTIIGSSLLAIPGVTFAILASGLFGPWLGSFYCLIGATIGALLSFLLSKYFLKDFVEKLVLKNERLYEIIYKIEPEKEWLILMITRLLPIFPFNLQNFAYGLTNISVKRYTLGSFLFMIPGIIFFSLGTAGFIDGSKRFLLFGLALVILLITISISLFLHKKYKILMLEEKYEG